MQKLVLNLDRSAELSLADQLLTIKKVGFDGVFITLHPEEVKGFAKIVKKEGMYFQSIHAPFDYAYAIWEEGSFGEEQINMLKNLVREAASNKIDLIIVHTIIGMSKHTPTELGLERFLSLFNVAKEYGVKIALENTEGEEYLDALINASEGNNCIGFCIDTGHEMCYNHSHDLITKYSSRLFSTHLNDNLGQTEKNITFYDDAHLMPFDGIANWNNIAQRLINADYNGDFTFELNRTSRRNRTANDIYNGLDYENFVVLAYTKAMKFRDLFNSLLMK